MSRPFLPPALMRATAIQRNILASQTTAQLEGCQSWMLNSSRDYGKDWNYYSNTLATQLAIKETEIRRRHMCEDVHLALTGRVF